MIAAIDLGTSSVKVLVTENGKTVKKAKHIHREKCFRLAFGCLRGTYRNHGKHGC